jgi:hypothetical protein
MSNEEEQRRKRLERLRHQVRRLRRELAALEANRRNALEADDVQRIVAFAQKQERLINEFIALVNKGVDDELE